jgi:hypothetical protein
MSKNAMAGAVTLCGVGLCVIGGALLMQNGLQAHAAAGSMPAVAAAVAATANAQAGPTVVWMGVTHDPGNVYRAWTYHRLWSDGRQETRSVSYGIAQISSCGFTLFPLPCNAQEWVEVPPPPGGNGFACRTDINGDRKVDAADLSFVLNAWGQEGGCEPEATHPCLDLGNLAGGVALK